MIFRLRIAESVELAVGIILCQLRALTRTTHTLIYCYHALLPVKVGPKRTHKKQSRWKYTRQQQKKTDSEMCQIEN